MTRRITPIPKWCIEIEIGIRPRIDIWRYVIAGPEIERVSLVYLRDEVVLVAVVFGAGDVVEIDIAGSGIGVVLDGCPGVVLLLALKRRSRRMWWDLWYGIEASVA